MVPTCKRRPQRNYRADDRVAPPNYLFCCSKAPSRGGGVAVSKVPAVPPSVPSPAIAAAKRELRQAAFRRRAEAAGRLGADAGLALRDRFLGDRSTVGAMPNAPVAGYWPMGEEIDVRPLLTALAGLGYLCLLPVVVAPRLPLIFRLWSPGDALEEGVFATRHPPAIRPPLSPRVVLVPLLAFDRSGYRLGYGGGFYDRTLAALRSYGGVTAVGVAYADQEVDSVPHAAHDQRLDWIVTEQALLKAA